MAKKRDMIVTIGPDGNVQITVEGVPGKGCLEFTKFLEEELGEVVNRTHTSEYFLDEEEVETEVKVGGS